MAASISVKFDPDEDDSSGACCKPRRQRPRPYVGNDADLAREMNELSVEERERVYDDIHGVSKIPDETPEFVNKCIKAMDEAIAEIPSKRRRAYNRAMFLKPALKDDSKFKLMFLRTDHFHADRAANRVVKYFEQKCALFGEQKLVKRITLQDMTAGGVDCFRRGGCATLPVKDQANRPILFFDISKFDATRATVDDVVHAFWYMVMATLEDDDDAQRKGFCAILRATSRAFFQPGFSRIFTEGSLRTGHCLIYCLPCRYTSYHVCYDDPQMNTLVQTLRVAIGKYIRMRIRPHIGSGLEIEYSLLTFGIEFRDFIQKAEAGNLEAGEEFIRLRTEIETKKDEQEMLDENTSGVILYPQSTDVLLGRGTPYQEFPGNLNWSQAIYDALDAYSKAETRFEKTCFSMDVVRKVKESKGRFLERTNAGWRVIDDQNAREKTAVAFRSRVKLSANGAIPLSTRLGTSTSSAAGNIAKRPRHDQM